MRGVGCLLLIFAVAPLRADAPATAAEVVDARPASWEEIAERCEASSDADTVADGHLVQLELDGGIYDLFVNQELALLCGVQMMKKPTVPSDPGLGRAADEAKRDLAARLSLPESQIQLRRAERVVWRDSSGGCPQPGQVYAQALTEGSRFVLLADGRSYLYHQVAGGSPFLCERPSPIEPLPAAPVE